MNDGELESTREIDFSHSFLVSSHFALIDGRLSIKNGEKLAHNNHVDRRRKKGKEMYSRKNISSELLLMKNIASISSTAASSRSFMSLIN